MDERKAFTKYILSIESARYAKEALKDLLAELKQDMTVSSADPSKVPVQSTTKKAIEERQIRLEHSVDAYELALAEFNDKILECEQRLYSLSRPEFGMVLRERFLNGHKLGWVAETYNYSERQIKRFTRRAIAEFFERYLKEEQ